MQYGSNFFQSTKQKPRKSSLPYPLPDPYATEIYDPHGLFQSKPREEIIGGEISGLSLALEKAKAIHHEPQEPQFDSPTALSEFELDVNMKQSGIENVVSTIIYLRRIWD